MKEKNNKHKRILGYSFLSFIFAILLAFGITLTNINSNVLKIKGSEGNPYSLTLDSSNKVTSNGDHDQYTAKGGKVAFTYSGVQSSTSGHVTLSSGGSLVNKDVIHSITSLTVNFSGSGTLSGKSAYVTSKWSDSFELVSGLEVDLSGTKPYYFQLNAANAAVTIESVTVGFTCQVNPSAEEQDNTGSFTVVFKADSTNENPSTNLTQSTSKSAFIESGGSYISSYSDITQTYICGVNGLKIGAKSNAGSVKFTLDKSYVISSVVVNAKRFNDSASCTLSVNSASGQSLGTSLANKTYTINSTTNTITFSANKYSFVKSFTVNYGEKVEPGTPEAPVYITGFGAIDSNKNSYTTNSIFDNDNGLHVYKTKSDSTQEDISKENYSYVVKDSNNNSINTAEKFPAEGLYTLIVSYETYVPIEIILNVGEYIYVTDIAASMETRTFTTADTLSANLANNIKANVEYSNNTESTDILYGEFAENGIGVKLINPKGITYDLSTPFGTAGSWTVKVYALDNEEYSTLIEITINAIPVTSITLDKTTHTMEVGDELQLVATVGPSAATNKEVVWRSDNEAAATVGENGLVTAVGTGKALITAEAADKSGVYGQCDLTITPKQSTVSDTLTRSTTGVSSGSSTYTSWNGKSGTSGAVYAGQSAGGNDAIQLRSSSDKNGNYSGIITTVSGGTIYKIIVDWQESTLDSRTLNVYGKSSAYSSPNDLYSTSQQGTLLGTIEKGVSTELKVTGSYEYVGVTSAASAMYLSSIEFVWGEPEAALPVYPTSITVSGNSSINVGSTSQLTYTFNSSDVNVDNVTWSTDKTNIATVSNGGLVTGVSAGTARITATAEAENGTISNYIDITVSEVAVTSVSLDTNSASVKVGKTVTLTATVYPSNAANKTITWSSNNTSVATVSGGIVTGVAAGEATITATSNNGKTATCVVTVTAASGGGGEESSSISYTDLDTGSYPKSETNYVSSSGIEFQAYYCANFNNLMQFKAEKGYIQTSEPLELQSITINNLGTNSLTVYGSNNAGSFSTTITGNNDTYDLTGYSYFKVARTSSGMGTCSSITIVTGTPTPTDPTSIIMSETTAEIRVGGTKQLSVSYVPSNANQNKEVTWTSSNTSVATVNSEGLVSVKSTATAGQTATITAKLTNITSITATCKITVAAQSSNDDHTVLIYICGADLETDNQLATGDIEEILKISGQPSDVNIVIETGGAKSWASTYGISSTKLERWHVQNKQLVKDDSLTYASMGAASTLQSFIEYGLNNYPADRTGLILWNHGGGMRGVCYDEKKNDDVLKNSEVRSAVGGALSNCGMSGQKLEWIGYDACLMAVQDIAETNSDYFNYMIASEESEAGYGWDYDTWIDDLYAKKDTTVILKAIVDGFIKDNGGTTANNNQTLSYMNLSYASAYKSAWEAMATALYSKVTDSNKSSFNSAITGNVYYYGEEDYDYFCTFDAYDFVDKLANNSAFSSFRIDSSYTTAVKNALANFVPYSQAQKISSLSHGIAMYWPNSTQYSDVKTYYTTSETRFTEWRKLCVNRGYHTGI